jgi:hypothetical protein
MNDSKTYPKGIHNKQCIGPCYEPNTYTIHPQTLKLMTHATDPICPTEQWIYKNPQKGEETLYHDICENPTDMNKINTDNLELDIFVPKFNFNCEIFLKLYYNITSFDKAIIWISENETKPLYSKIRILECTLKAWGNTEQFVITDILIDFFIIIIKKIYLKSLYDDLYKYIIGNAQNDSIKLGYSKDSKDKYIVEKQNYIINKLLTRNIIYKLLLEYQSDFESKWNTINNHVDKFKFYIANYLEQTIIKTIS